MKYHEYEKKYFNDDYFHNRKWINNYYVKNIIIKTCIPTNSYILDVGCGQGHFSYLFNKFGMQVLGIDLSKAGILYAEKYYVANGLHFLVSDAFALPLSMKYDCVFTRSLSLYNTDNIKQIQNVTEKLISYLKNGGVFIFCYNVNFNKNRQSDSWKFHSLNDIKRYFSCYNNKSIYFISKVDCLLLGKFAFSKICSHINMIASRSLGFGGEIVCFIRK